MLLRLLLGVVLSVSWLSAQTGTIQRQVGNAAVTIYRPVITQNGNQIVPQTGLTPAYGIAMGSGSPGDFEPTGTYGELPCEFDAPPVIGRTATLMNGFCHSDASVINDSDVFANLGAPGRIMSMRPDLGPNFATINFRFPSVRGSKMSVTLISDINTEDTKSVAGDYTTTDSDRTIVETQADSVITLDPTPKPSVKQTVKNLSPGDISVTNGSNKIDLTASPVVLHSRESMTFHNLKTTNDWIVE